MRKATEAGGLGGGIRGQQDAERKEEAWEERWREASMVSIVRKRRTGGELVPIVPLSH